MRNFVLTLSLVASGLILVAPVFAGSGPAPLPLDELSCPGSRPVLLDSPFTIKLTCSGPVCAWGETLTCSCPGNGNCQQSGTQLTCTCTGSPPVTRDCCSMVGAPLPPNKCVVGVRCDNRCGNSCGYGSCIQGECVCEF